MRNLTDTKFGLTKRTSATTGDEHADADGADGAEDDTEDDAEDAERPRVKRKPDAAGKDITKRRSAAAGRVTMRRPAAAVTARRPRRPTGSTGRGKWTFARRCTKTGRHYPVWTSPMGKLYYSKMAAATVKGFNL